MSGFFRETIELLDVEATKQKAQSVLAQIKRMQSDDFPYKESKGALDQIAALFEADLQRLGQIDTGTDQSLRRQACAHTNNRVALYHRVLGFILRSTNVRNPFEVYDPLLKICRSAYGPKAKLILSSEWNFSPFTYPATFQDLPDLILIGLPATESGNSLIFPLAGHELGHSIWRRPTSRGPSVNSPLLEGLRTALLTHYQKNWAEFDKLFEPKKDSTHLLTDLFLQKIWAQSLKLASRQLEELFCDLFGLAIFGEGFLYSFLYVLSPNLGPRVDIYPTLERRTKVLIDGARRFAFDIPANFGSYFSEESPSLDLKESFILRMADAVGSEIVRLNRRRSKIRSVDWSYASYK
jgi:hypothetical protein